MNHWPVPDARARFSQLLDACVNEGPQVITLRGTETAVLVPFAEWKRMCEVARPLLKTLLLSDAARTGLVLPPRGQAKRRPPARVPDCKA